MYVLDASVVVKWFVEEEGNEIALLFREKFWEREIDIIVPDLLLYEISNALRYNPKFDENDVKNAIESIINMGIRILIPSLDILKKAIDIAFLYGITLYDAYYVALSDELKIPFVTADKKLFDKIKKFSLAKYLSSIQL